MGQLSDCTGCAGTGGTIAETTPRMALILRHRLAPQNLTASQRPCNRRLRKTELTSSTVISVLLVSVGLTMAWGSLVRLRWSLKSTTLIPAGRWAGAAASLWSLTWTLDHVLRRLSQSAADHLWYAAAVVALCPAIAVLGSRRPGTRVWTWFILIPLLFALGWPVITLWVQGSEVRGLQLESPQLAGYLLVLVMGAGNYFGTRHTLAGLSYVIANTLLVLSSSSACPAWLSDRWWSRLLATGCMALAVVIAVRPASRTAVGLNRFDRLWLDFFDQFGVVWGRRIQDRVNFVAQKEGWPARLELHGVVWDSGPDPATEARIEHTFRWLLRRFVDPEWIDERLGASPSGEQVSAIGADS